jgi:RNA polymerase sigma-70 factor (ECF subfamily)
LGRLRQNPRDEKSWSEFVERYGAMMLTWCARWGLQPNDAEDVTQNVLVQLAKQMREFEYDPDGSFRGWLRTLAYRAWCDLIASQSRKRQQYMSDEVLAVLESEDACRAFLEQIDSEARQDRLEEAMERARLRVEPHTWRAFELTALQNVSGDEAALQLNMNIGAVYVAKSRIVRMIRQYMGQDY